MDQNQQQFVVEYYLYWESNNLPQGTVEQRRQEQTNESRNVEQFVAHEERQNLVPLVGQSEFAWIAGGVRCIDDGAHNPGKWEENENDGNVHKERSADEL